MFGKRFSPSPLVRCLAGSFLLVPCIVAHALFNSLAMLVLWRMVYLNAE
jgi:hypothetical protein